jgi:hypothetical protein
MVAIVLVCGYVYFWTALQYPNTAFGRAPQGYYGLLTEGFRSGHLYAAIEPHPALLALPDPYDPVANAPYRVHDMSLFEGKYYLYFGVTPVVLLFLPVRLLTGFYPTEPFAVAFFLTVGLVAGAGLIGSVRRRWFPDAPAWIAPLAVACLGLASPVALLAQWAEFYQVPIACAYGLHMLVLAMLHRTLLGGPKQYGWLAAASLLFGLSVGARPNYLPGGLMLALAAGWVWRTSPTSAHERLAGARRLLLAAFGPAAAVGAGLLLYNWLRFGSFTEFGVSYMLAGSKQTNYVPFSFSNLWSNGGTYLWGAGAWSSYFPYFAPTPGTTLGMLRYLPWLWLMPFAFWLPGGGVGEIARAARRFFAGIVAVSASVNLTLLSAFSGVNDRYAGDIVPTWLLLAALGALALGEFRPGPTLARRALAGAVVAGAVCSVCIGQAVLFRRLPLDGHLLAFARVMNRPTAMLERLRGEELGALRLELELPTGKVGTSEPLFQTGLGPPRRDWLYIEYLAADRARLGFFHAGLGAMEGSEFAIPADRRLTVEVRCGSLLPPVAHPYYAGWDPLAVETVRRDLQVKVNGVETLRAMLECYESTADNLVVGALTWPSGGIANRFSGRILQSTRLPFASVEPRAPDLMERAPVELTLLFPADRQTGAEPVLSTGRGNQSDLLYCVYEGRNGIRFALDHYGNGGPRSERIEYDPLQPHRLTVWMGSLAEAAAPPAGAAATPPSQRLVVMFDGKVVLNLEQNFYPAAPASAVIGFNAHRSSTAEQRFSGRVLEVRPAAFASLPPLILEGERGAVEMTVVFPTHVMGIADPLVVTGLTGAGNIVYVRYIDSRHVSFGFDHWGIGGITGAPVEIDYGQSHRVEVTMGSLYAPGVREELRTLVRVKLDGKTVLEGKSPTHPSTPGQIRLLTNPIGGSTCGPTFNGRMISVERLAEPRR